MPAAALTVSSVDDGILITGAHRRAILDLIAHAGYELKKMKICNSLAGATATKPAESTSREGPSLPNHHTWPWVLPTQRKDNISAKTGFNHSTNKQAISTCIAQRPPELTSSFLPRVL